METLITPFDVLFRNFFDSHSGFSQYSEVKSPHPVNLIETPEGLAFEVACVGLCKEDIDIQIEHDIIRIKYEKPREESIDKYLIRGIAQRSFNLGYKISSRFNLQKAQASMDKGLLIIEIPFAEASKPKSLHIK